MLPTRSGRAEVGSGVVASALGAVVFLSFLLLATHVALGLFATSVATSAAFDAASTVARSSEGAELQAVADAEVLARTRLPANSQPTFEWMTDDQGDIGLRLELRRPSVLPEGLAERSGLLTIDRTVWVRREQLR